MKYIAATILLFSFIATVFDHWEIGIYSAIVTVAILSFKRSG